MNPINPDLFNKFLDGEANALETMRVLEAIKTVPFWRQRYIAVKRFEAMLAEEEKNDVIPEDNYSDYLCERYILRNLFPEYIAENQGTATNDGLLFLQRMEKGPSVYNDGRVMEKHGLAVTRQYRAGLGDLQTLTDNGEGVIALIEREALNGEAKGAPDQAVCVLKANDKEVTFFNPVFPDPEDMAQIDVCPTDKFMKAWESSRYYLVSANRPENKVYLPYPAQLDDQDFDGDLLELRDALAEDLHDEWAAEQMEAGVTEAQDQRLRPFSLLSDADKEPERQDAARMLTRIQRLGYTIHHPDALHAYHCPTCGKPIELVHSFCPFCGKELGVEDY